MGTRIIAALIGLGVVLPALFMGGQIALEILVFVVLLVGLDEYARMAAPDTRRGALAVMVLAGVPVYAVMNWGLPAQLGGVLAGASLLVLLYGLLLVPETNLGERTATRLLAGVLYVPLLLSFIPLVRRFEDGIAWVMLLLVITWMGDTGAYFAGRAFGRHKLYERISPKKTWEGAIGGMVAAVLGACLVKAIGLPNLPWPHVIALGILCDAFGVVGDLTESMLKRSFGVKDSGWIMPGHGGILDRIDSLLFSAPVAWLYATTFGLG